MTDLGDRLNRLPVHEHAPDFWSDLETALRSSSARPAGADHDEFDRGDELILLPTEELRHRRRRRAAAVFAAAAVLTAVLLGIEALGEDSSPTPVITDQKPPPRPATTDTAATTSPPPPTTVDWSFDVVYIDVDAGSVVAASDDIAWVASSRLPQASRIDLATDSVTDTVALAVPPVPYGGSLYAFESAWFESEEGISRLDSDSGEILATLPVGDIVVWISEGFGSVWASSRTGFHRIDPTTNTLSASIDVVNAGASIDLDGSMWVRAVDGVISRIDPATDQVVDTIPTPTGAYSIWAADGSLWAPGGLGESVVYRIDPATGEVEAEIDMSRPDGSPTSTEHINFLGGTVWQVISWNCDVECDRGIARIDPETDDVVAFQPLRPGWTTGGGAVTTTDRLWLSNSDSVAYIEVPS